jgi:hypothetical protein
MMRSVKDTSTSAGAAGPVGSLDALVAADVRAMTGAERSAHLVGLARAQAALDAAQLEAVAVWDAEQGWAPEGCRSAGGWLAPRTGLTRAAAGHRVKVARFLRGAPLVQGSLAAGRISFAKAALFAQHVTTDAQLAHFAHHEGWLVEQVEGLTVEQAARFLAQWAAQADPDAADEGEERRLAGRAVRVSETLDGVGHLTGTLTAAGLAVFGQVFVNICEEMRRADMALPPEERRTAAQIGHDALIEMARRAAAWKAHQMPSSAPSVTLVLTWGQLMAEQKSAKGPTVHGPAITTADARRLACDADIARLLVGPDGEPLDLGRSARLFSRAQRKALFARFGGCAGPGCDTPPERCDIHHVREWLRDLGETNINDGVPLGRTCVCHDNVHRGIWDVTTDTFGTPTFTYPDGTPVPDPRRAMADA